MSEYSNFTFFTILFVSAWIILNAVCQISVKSGIMQVQGVQESGNFFDKENLFRILSNKMIIIGFILYLVSTIFWFGALTRLDISLISPLGSLIFIMTALLAMVFLGEKITPVRWGAIIVIVIGVFFLVKS